MPKYILNPYTGNLDATGSGSTLAIGTVIPGADPNSVLVTDAASSLQDVGTLTDGQIVIGSTGNTPVKASLTGTANQVTVTSGPGSIALSLPQDIATTSSPTFNVVAANVDKSGTLAIGGTLATQVQLGTVSSTTLIKGQLDLNSNQIHNVLTPSVSADAANKGYVDSEISALSSVYIPLTQKGAALGVATLDGGGKVPVSQLPNSVMELQGFWNAATNTPTLVDGTGNPGDVWEVSVAGTVNFGSGPIVFAVGDWAVYAADAKWHKSINSNEVTSVNGYKGTVVLTTSDIAEGSNLYYTDGRAQASIVGGASTIVTSNLTANRALLSDVSGKVAVSSVSNTELSYLSGVTSAIQTQFSGKANVNLGNLSSTAFNVDLLPDGDSSRNIGSNSLRIQNIFTTNISGGASAPNIALLAGMLQDATSTDSIDFGTRKLKTASITKLDWSGTDVSLNTRKLIDVVDPTALQDAATKNYVDTSIAAVPVSSAVKQTITLSSTDITNQYVDLSNVIVANTAILTRLGVVQRQGYDYSVSLTGGVGGKTRISFTSGGDLASSGGYPVIAGDILEVQYLVGISVSTGAVTSVNGYTGAVVLTKADLALGNVDNVSDLNKPISTLTQNALNLKADITTSIVNALIYG